METECAGEQLAFEGLGRRKVIGRFDGGRLSSDAGGVLLRETDRPYRSDEASCQVFCRPSQSQQH